MRQETDIASLLRSATERLSHAGIEGAAREARLLLEHAAGIPVATQIAFGERLVGASDAEGFERVVQRRAAREPLSHIVGRREFWSLDFSVNGETLDPRADSETLIEAVLRQLSASDVDYRRKPWSLIDFGTGTGCLLLALLSELPMAHGLGIDINPGAIAVAASNAVRLGLAARASFQCGNWDRGIDARYDVVLSNPPYIPTADIETLQPEVARYEPRLALDGGADGLDAYRALALAAVRVKASSGFAAFEIGIGQANDVRHIMASAGLRHMATESDLQGHERIVMFR
ncbi:peptide chain release factor N(5)-glutamine methyltransferase [Dongia soli]|uniref:Release factor glutamine methyltransferase n=1 Tax=Dongia soli TaxID=600628 RepID=A0ABU5E823_9PROT|nr:peptide chain release factor N(5)-glutamine methyltransferase [Dongia soli]MDY0882490.1 peptide chain release factor N(5)-glutamine methyltransferase [Dongia soli]